MACGGKIATEALAYGLLQRIRLVNGEHALFLPKPPIEERIRILETGNPCKLLMTRIPFRTHLLREPDADHAIVGKKCARFHDIPQEAIIIEKEKMLGETGNAVEI